MINNSAKPKKRIDLAISWTSLIKIVASLAFFLVIQVVTTSAQNDNYIQSNASLAEKVYLQLDGKVYTTGSIVWFNSIVSNAANHVPSKLSGVLHVELIGPNERILEKKLIKLIGGIGQGFFYLDKTMPEGLYLVRAYTLWNKNFGSDFIFEEYIQVFAPKQNNSETPPISNVSLTMGKDNENRVEACFDPFVIDSLHKNKLTVYITVDNKKDSLLVKKGKDNKYWIDYNVPPESQFATLQMQTANQQKYSKTIVLNDDYLDLQFLPESGELVHGLQSKVGFKALNANGEGKMVQGDIVDENDTIITSFKSNSLGMGSFILNKPDSTKTYYAKLMSSLDDNQELLYPLPRAASLGNVLSVEKHGDDILVIAKSNYIKNDSIHLNISFRGVSFYDMNASLKEGFFKLRIPGNQLPEGIISCTMSDLFKRVLAQRLYFNQRLESRINIALSTKKNNYAKRELTNLEIETTNANNEPIKTKLSLLVINKQQMGQMQQKRQNILSYFLLGSELKGDIENPGFYFRNDSTKYFDLDALMLTQGWRKYKYSKPYTKLSFQPEMFLSVSGQVNAVFSEKKKKQADLTLMTFGKNKSIYTQTADSLGKFNFRLNDEYGQNVNVLIQSAKKTGKKMNYNITLDKIESPEIHFNQVKTVEKLDSVVQVFVEKNEERKKIDDAFPLQAGNILIDEVEVTGYRLTPNRKKVMERYGEPNDVIEGEELEAKEEDWSYGLYSVLLFNYPDKLVVRRVGGGSGFLYAYVANGAEGPTLVVIDGVSAKREEYPYIPNIPPSEVSSFEIIEYAKDFMRLFLEVFPDAKPNEIPVHGNVIAIYTYGQKGIYGTQPAVGIMKASVPVFSEAREFYAPKYEKQEQLNSSKPDLRALVHWEPVLKTDSLGKAAASFYNADNVGKMMVVVEAISTKGEIGYQEIEYNIEGKEQEVIIIN